MPQSIVNLIGKMKTREIQLCVIILSVCFVTGGTGWRALADRIDKVEHRQQEQQLEQAEFKAEFKAVSEKIDIIHDHVVRKGLESSSTTRSNDASIFTN